MYFRRRKTRRRRKYSEEFFVYSNFHEMKKKMKDLRKKMVIEAAL